MVLLAYYMTLLYRLAAWLASVLRLCCSLTARLCSRSLSRVDWAAFVPSCECAVPHMSLRRPLLALAAAVALRVQVL